MCEALAFTVYTKTALQIIQLRQEYPSKVHESSSLLEFTSHMIEDIVIIILKHLIQIIEIFVFSYPSLYDHFKKCPNFL